ncbi:MAG: DUF885 domain-containing protein [Hydrogenophilaceae bacterium]|jgi:uncharacterized protein (DUF885 family)|nr:DUF885 domain-containing protein [Hydrogenophilaceae bacterium]
MTIALNRRAFLATAASTAALAACQTMGPPAAGDGAALTAFLDAAFDRRLAQTPELATQLGDRRGYDRWNDESVEQEERELAELAEAVAAMRARFDPETLDAQGALSFRLFEKQLEREAARAPWRHHTYRFDQMNGAQSDLPAFLINAHQVASVSDAEAYVSRLSRFGAKMDQLLERAAMSAERGIMPPRFVYEYVLRDCRNVIAGAPFTNGEASPLWSDLQAKVNALAPETATSAEKERLIAAGRAALVDVVKPAYERAIAALSAQQTRAGEDDGVWRLPDGAAFYAHQLARYTTTALTADEIHAIGLSEVARIHAAMDEIKNAVGFDGDRSAFFTFMRSDPRFYVPDTAEGKAEYVRLATAAIDAMRGRLPAYFGRLPRAPLVVRQVEAFRERSAGLAFYERPTLDGSRPGVYYVNTFINAAIPTYQIEALAFHEGVPGHHMQIAIAQELTGIPRFRTLGGYTAYSEGWGLYAEYLGKEMGFYQDPYSDFGRLTLELHRAVRLVVDTGIHHKRWTRQQAIDYTLANKPDSEPQARRDIDRYIVFPGQATAYKIGQMEILRLRREAEAAMGERFDIRGFHDLVLGSGALPLDILGEQVRAWSGAG